MTSLSFFKRQPFPCTLPGIRHLGNLYRPRKCPQQYNYSIARNAEQKRGKKYFSLKCPPGAPFRDAALVLLPQLVHSAIRLFDRGIVQLGAQAGLYVRNILLPQGLLLCLSASVRPVVLLFFASSLMRAIFSCVMVPPVFSSGICYNKKANPLSHCCAMPAPPKGRAF